MQTNQLVTLRLDASNEDPKLVSYPLGIPSSGHEAEDDALQLIIGSKAQAANKKMKHIISSHLNGVTYRGCDYDEHSVKNDSCRYLIGVLPAEGKDQLMILKPAEHIFVMRPELLSKEVVPRSSTMTNYERKSSLTEGKP
jgi:hypothetical protein